MTNNIVLRNNVKIFGEDCTAMLVSWENELDYLHASESLKSMEGQLASYLNLKKELHFFHSFQKRKKKQITDILGIFHEMFKDVNRTCKR